MRILELLAKDHKKWVNLVEKLGASSWVSEDIVQDAYIKISRMKNPEKFMYKENEPNYWYFCLTLNSVYVDHCKKNSIPTESFDFSLAPSEDADIEKEESWERLYVNIIAYINSFGKYGSVLSQMYFKTDYSLRDLSEMGDIGLSSLYNSIKKYRQDIRDEFGEDYEDFKNGDYDKI